MLRSQSIFVVILNWNNAPDTLRCVDSLLADPSANTEIIVVDNGSDDGSWERLSRDLRAGELISSGANLGYAGGNNVGIRRALDRGADFVFVLNNDVVVEPGCIDALYDALTCSPEAGVAGPLIAEEDGQGIVWALGAEIDWDTAEVGRRYAGTALAEARSRQATPMVVDATPGTALFVRRKVFEHAGLFDEAYFLYYEEMDWCVRVGREGYRIRAVPAATVWHRVSATLGPASPHVDYYMVRNHLRFVDHNWSGTRRSVLLARLAVRYMITIAAFTAKPHDGARIPNRNARIQALRDAARGHWGKMPQSVPAQHASQASLARDAQG